MSCILQTHPTYHTTSYPAPYPKLKPDSTPCPKPFPILQSSTPHPTPHPTTRPTPQPNRQPRQHQPTAHLTPYCTARHKPHQEPILISQNMNHDWFWLSLKKKSQAFRNSFTKCNSTCGLLNIYSSSIQRTFAKWLHKVKFTEKPRNSLF